MKNLVKMEKIDDKRWINGKEEEWVAGWLDEYPRLDWLLYVYWLVYTSLGGIKFIRGNPTLSTLESILEKKIPAEDPYRRRRRRREEKVGRRREGGEGREEKGGWIQGSIQHKLFFLKGFCFPQLTAIVGYTNNIST